MSFNQEKAFDVSNGFVVEDGCGMFSGQGSPVGSQAVVGSRYFDCSTGLKYLKYGADADNWVPEEILVKRGELPLLYKVPSGYKAILDDPCVALNGVLEIEENGVLELI